MWGCPGVGTVGGGGGGGGGWWVGGGCGLTTRDEERRNQVIEVGRGVWRCVGGVWMWLGGVGGVGGGVGRGGVAAKGVCGRWEEGRTPASGSDDDLGVGLLICLCVFVPVGVSGVVCGLWIEDGWGCT